jgi:hypothetical protein
MDFTNIKLDKANKITALPSKIKIDPTISRYFEKAEEVNSKWKINILGSSDILQYYLTTGIEDKLNGDSIDWVLDFINNPNIAVQKKSDLIRIILLKYYGGIWIDASTFLISSLDWIDTLDSDFICPYIHVDQYAQFSLPPVTHYSDKLKTANYGMQEDLNKCLKEKGNNYILTIVTIFSMIVAIMSIIWVFIISRRK